MMGNQLKERAEQIDVYNNFLAGLFNLILGQCTKLMKDKLHTRAEKDQINQTQNVPSLICTITHTYDERQVKQVHALDKYKEDYDALKWEQGQSMDDFYKAFRVQVQVCKDVGLQLYDDSLLSQIANENGCVNPNDEDHTAALEVATAI